VCCGVRPPHVTLGGPTPAPARLRRRGRLCPLHALERVAGVLADLGVHALEGAVAVVRRLLDACRAQRRMRSRGGRSASTSARGCCGCGRRGRDREGRAVLRRRCTLQRRRQRPQRQQPAAIVASTAASRRRRLIGSIKVHSAGHPAQPCVPRAAAATRAMRTAAAEPPSADRQLRPHSCCSLDGSQPGSRRDAAVVTATARAAAALRRSNRGTGRARRSRCPGPATTASRAPRQSPPQTVVVGAPAQSVRRTSAACQQSEPVHQPAAARPTRRRRQPRIAAADSSAPPRRRSPRRRPRVRARTPTAPRSSSSRRRRTRRQPFVRCVHPGSSAARPVVPHQRRRRRDNEARRGTIGGSCRRMWGLSHTHRCGGSCATGCAPCGSCASASWRGVGCTARETGGVRSTRRGFRREPGKLATALPRASVERRRCPRRPGVNNPTRVLTLKQEDTTLCRRGAGALGVSVHAASGNRSYRSVVPIKAMWGPHSCTWEAGKRASPFTRPASLYTRCDQPPRARRRCTTA
jgi:hypothetical protein